MDFYEDLLKALEDAHPKRILQIYDAEKQDQYKAMTPRDRFEWLAAINHLYWAGIAARQESLAALDNAQAFMLIVGVIEIVAGK